MRNSPMGTVFGRGDFPVACDPRRPQLLDQRLNLAHRVSVASELLLKQALELIFYLLGS
jgi:hypothetical protein